MARLAIFDCDGTLVDSGGTIHRALTLSLAAHGHPVPPRRDARRVIGLSLVEAMARLVPRAEPDEHDRLAQTYRATFQELRAGGEVDEPLFDGIGDLLDTLEADGWRLAIATGKSDRGLAHCLECHGLAGRFVSRQTADRHPSKPHPSMALAAMAEAGAEPRSTVMIGDTGWDMAMAHAAGVGALGVAWGYQDERELLREGAQAVARSPAEVPGLARQSLRDAA